MKRREAKSKGEKERYKHLNAEFQRIARSDKKAFLSNQCKEIEENNRMGKTRDLFKKIRDTKGIFHAKMGLIKDRNGMDLREADDIKKRWQEYTEELYKKDLHPFPGALKCLKQTLLGNSGQERKAIKGNKRSERRSNQSILKEISPGVSLEGMMLKLKLQYFGTHRHASSLSVPLNVNGY